MAIVVLRHLSRCSCFHPASAEQFAFRAPAWAAGDPSGATLAGLPGTRLQTRASR